MAVKITMASGEDRIVNELDGAPMDGPFFLATRWYSNLQSSHTVLTLRSRDVVRAEIQKDDGTTEYVLGAGLPSKD